jgi:hypothetical protein
MMTVTYDENNKMYTIKNNTNITKELEMNLSVNKNNELKKLANVTTLTKDDINLLYHYAQLKFSYEQDEIQFLDTPLKLIFPSLQDESLNELMILAHNYVINKKDEPIKKITNNKNYFFYLIIFVLFLLNILAIYYLCKM